MKIEVDRVYLPETAEGEFVHEKVIEETKAEGRHKMLCNWCGMSIYPECRSWCPNGGEDKVRDVV